MPVLIQELRLAVRGLGRGRGFAAGALATLAVAIAVNTALFAFLNAIFFRPLPWGDVGSLRHLTLEARADEAFPVPAVGTLRERLEGVARLGAYRELELVIGGPAGAGSIVSGTELEPVVLELIGATPVAGRLPTDREAGSAVVVIDEELAVARFGSAGAAVGGTLRLDGTARTVMGVLPARLAFPDFARVWLPADAAARPADGAMALIVLLAPGAVEADVTARLAPAAGLVRLRPVQPQARSETAILLGALGFLLVIACGNVANLVLARGTARRHELAVRAALGASRGRIVRGLLAEGVVLAAAAAVLGGLLGAWLTDGITGLIPADQLPRWFRASMDVRVLAWIAGAAGVVTLIVSGLPALALTRGGVAALLAVSGARTSDGAAGRMRGGLVAVQIALATVLLSGAGLLGRSLVALRAGHPGYDAAAVLQLQTRLPQMTPDRRFAASALEALGALPAVDAVAARWPARLPGTVAASTGTPLAARIEAVSPAFFRTTGLPLLHGRAFTGGEAQAGDFAVISAPLATALFGTADAVGRSVRTGEVVLTIVGVAAARRELPRGGIDGVRPARHLYVSEAHASLDAVELLLRIPGDPRVQARSAAAAVAALSPDVVVRPARTLAQAEREAGTDLRFFTALFGGFGLLATVLAAIGIGGVVAFSVSRRTREIGVRIALGATATRVVRHVIAGVLPAAGAGLAIGLAGALGVTRLLRGALFGLADTRPLALAGVALLFLLVTLVAAWLPARRALHIDPVTALRDG